MTLTLGLIVTYALFFVLLLRVVDRPPS